MADTNASRIPSATHDTEDEHIFSATADPAAVLDHNRAAHDLFEILTLINSAYARIDALPIEAADGTPLADALDALANELSSTQFAAWAAICHLRPTSVEALARQARVVEHLIVDSGSVDFRGDIDQHGMRAVAAGLATLGKGPGRIEPTAA